MDVHIKQKLNLLIHLALVDGKFHKAEKALLEEFVAEMGFDTKDFQLLALSETKTDELTRLDDKKEMLFLALRLIRADNFIDKKELAFCKDIATKLGYDAAIIDEYAHGTLDRASFDKSVNNWLL